MPAAGFTRRYTTDQTLDELLAIEGVVILDRVPQGAPNGAGSGVVCVVGEFEDGPFSTPTEVSSGADLASIFGGFGYTYDGLVACNPSARARYADGAAAAEYWNGNGYLACFGKAFARLVVQRVDTTVGAVTLTRQAYLDGGSDYSWQLTTGQVLSLKLDGAAAAPAAFTGAVASVVSSAITFPVVMVGGYQMVLTIDKGTPEQIGPVTVQFLATDTTQALIIARINLAMGYTCASSASATTTRLSGRIGGTSGKVVIESITPALAALIGFSAGTTSGTGNVADISRVTNTEVKAIIEAAFPTNGRVDVVDGHLRLSSKTATTGSVEVVSASTTIVGALGFPLDTAGTIATATAAAVTIPAGFRVRTAGGEEWVVAQSVSVAAGAASASARIRPANDNETGTSQLAGAITVIPYQTTTGSWSCVNPLPVSAPLTDAQIDAAYLAAFDATLALNSVARNVEIIVSARQSNAIRTKAKANALAASQTLRGRIAVIRPPLATKRAVARSTTAQPGVGAYRSDSVVYAYPGVRTYVPLIASRGLAGGAGFTADGYVDLGADTWEASLMSQLAPEENPGQLTEYLLNVLSLETGNPEIANLVEADYRLFKSAGIAAIRMSDGQAVLQSGITSVDPLSSPSLTAIKRRRMASYIQDTLAIAVGPYSKRLTSRQARAEVVSVVTSFLDSLNPKIGKQRIDSYVIDAVSLNTPETLAAGLFKIRVKVRLLASMDVIVLDTEIGEGVSTVSLAA